VPDKRHSAKSPALDKAGDSGSERYLGQPASFWPTTLFPRARPAYSINVVAPTIWAHCLASVMRARWNQESDADLWAPPASHRSRSLVPPPSLARGPGMSDLSPSTNSPCMAECAVLTQIRCAPNPRHVHIGATTLGFVSISSLSCRSDFPLTSIAYAVVAPRKDRSGAVGSEPRNSPPPRPQTSPRRTTRRCGVCWGQGAREIAPSTTGISHRRLQDAVDRKASWPAFCASRLTLGTPSGNSILLTSRLAILGAENSGRGHRRAEHRRDCRRRLLRPRGGRDWEHRPITIARPR
jgi:hypothetical protein